MQLTLISPATRLPTHRFFVFAETPATSATSPTNSCPGVPRNAWYPRNISSSVLQIPANRTRTKAHPGRNLGIGLRTSANFLPLTTKPIIFILGFGFFRKMVINWLRHAWHFLMQHLAQCLG
jgi:hypothetical protein